MLIGLQASTALAKPCGVAASVEGDDAVTVRAVRDELVRRGVAVDAPASCARVRAVLKRRAQQVSVRVEDAWGRASKRLVSEPESAATVIESWARDDLSAPLLAAQPEGPRETIQAPDLEIAPAHASPPTQPPPSRPAKSRGFSVSALADTAVGTDGSLWLGVDAAACVRFGILCAGLLARLSFDTETQGASERFETGRTALDLLVGFDVPWSVGAFRIIPGLAMGAGWIHSIEPPGDDEEVSDTGGLRGDAHLAIALPIGSELAIVLALHGDLLVFTSAEELPGGATVAHPLLGMARASIGLRYEMP